MAWQTAAPLRPGDAMAVVAVSSALADAERLHEGVNLLESWGLRCQPHSIVGRQWGYLAGRDEQRLGDLLPETPVSLLACARGGWGAARLLERNIPWQSGWLLGFSDVTALLWGRLAAEFDGGVHGPLLTTLSSEPEWSQTRLRQLLFGEEVPDLQGRGLGGGISSGPLLVANLTVASHLLGSPWVPSLDGVILILEDVGEAPYRIDRMLTHWRLCGALNRLAGLGFGSFSACEDDRPDQLNFSVRQVLEERTADLNIPRVMDLPVGHQPGNAALPLGRQARLDGENGQLSLLS